MHNISYNGGTRRGRHFSLGWTCRSCKQKTSVEKLFHQDPKQYWRGKSEIKALQDNFSEFQFLKLQKVFSIFYLIIIMRKTSKPISCEILSEKFSESDSQQFESYQITGCISLFFWWLQSGYLLQLEGTIILPDPSIRQTDLRLSLPSTTSYSPHPPCLAI